MKKIGLVLFVIFVGMFFSGCVGIETVLKINRDGSGEIIETIAMSKEMLAQMEAMMSFASGMTGEEGAEMETPHGLFNKETFEEAASKFGGGVRFVSMEEKEDGNMKHCKVVYAFDDINNVVLDQNQGNRISSTMEQGGKEEKEPIVFSFSRGAGSSTLSIRMPERKVDGDEPPEMVEPQEMPQEMEEAQIEMMKQMFKGLHFVMKVDCNGKIVETNATHVDGNTVTLLDIDFGMLMDNVDKLKELESKKPEGVEGLKEICKGIEGMKFEMEKEVTVQFK